MCDDEGRRRLTRRPIALVGNMATLTALQQSRGGGMHVEASWIFTKNDVKANVLVMAAAAVTFLIDSPIPDLVAGIVIFGVIARGSRQILKLSAAGATAP